MKRLPKKVKILETVYNINYFNSHIEVDPKQKEKLEGYYDPTTDTIRIYKGEREYSTILQTIWHEIVHIIAEKTRIESLKPLSKNEVSIDLLATGINTVLMDNPTAFNYKKEKKK